MGACLNREKDEVGELLQHGVVTFTETQLSELKQQLASQVRGEILAELRKQRPSARPERDEDEEKLLALLGRVVSLLAVPRPPDEAPQAVGSQRTPRSRGESPGPSGDVTAAAKTSRRSNSQPAPLSAGLARRVAEAAAAATEVVSQKQTEPGRVRRLVAGLLGTLPPAELTSLVWQLPPEMRRLAAGLPREGAGPSSEKFAAPHEPSAATAPATPPHEASSRGSGLRGWQAEMSEAEMSEATAAATPGDARQWPAPASESETSSPEVSWRRPRLGGPNSLKLVEEQRRQIEAKLKERPPGANFKMASHWGVLESGEAEAAAARAKLLEKAKTAEQLGSHP